MKNAAYKIKLYRENKKMKKNELAKIIGVSPAYISMLESGKKENPSDEIKFKLSKALDVNIRDIFETTYESYDELLENQCNEFYQQNLQIFDHSFVKVRDMIDALVHSSSFKNEFKLDVNTLKDNEIDLIINKIYDNIGWICYKLNKDK